MNKERVKQFTTMLIALCLALSTCLFTSPQRAHGAERVGYWRLTGFEVFDTNYYSHIGPIQISADSGGNYCDATHAWSDDTDPIPEQRRKTYTYQYMNWTSSTVWTNPPETIQLGKEDELTLTLQQKIGNIEYRLGEKIKKHCAISLHCSPAQNSLFR